MYNIKIYFILWLIVSCCHTSGHAQWYVSIEAGCSSNLLDKDLSSISSTQNKHGNGIQLAMGAIYTISPAFNLNMNVGYIQKNSSLIRTGIYEGGFTNQHNGYVHLPITLHWNGYKYKKIILQLYTGGYAAYWMYGQTSGKIPNLYNSWNEIDENGQVSQKISLESYSEKYRFNSTKDRRIEWGWLAGAGINYQICHRYSLFSHFSYLQAITPQQKTDNNNQSGAFNKTIAASIGCLYRL
jgi:hypothetical protein